MHRYIAIILLLFANLAIAADLATDMPNIVFSLIRLEDRRVHKLAGPKGLNLMFSAKIAPEIVLGAIAILDPIFSFAQDSKGNSLLTDPKHRFYGEKKPEPLLYSFEKLAGPLEEIKGIGTLKNPARDATTASFKGVIPIYIPSRDPEAVVERRLDSLLNQTIVFKKQGVSVHFERGSLPSKPDGFDRSDIVLALTDPDNHMAHLELFTSDGTPLMYKSWGFNDKPDKIFTYNYEKPPAGNTMVKLYFTTPRSLLNIPFDMKDVSLP